MPIAISALYRNTCLHTHYILHTPEIYIHRPTFRVYSFFFFKDLFIYYM